MSRTDYVLAILSASEGAPLAPVQVQKLFFLLERKAKDLIGGPYFKFEPYDYGPFDKAVYCELRSLEQSGDVVVETDPKGSLRKYRPSSQGLETGVRLLANLPDRGEYARVLSQWVRSQTFASLVSSVYNEYPEMKVNSVFR